MWIGIGSDLSWNRIRVWIYSANPDLDLDPIWIQAGSDPIQIRSDPVPIRSRSDPIRIRSDPDPIRSGSDPIRIRSDPDWIGSGLDSDRIGPGSDPDQKGSDPDRIRIGSDPDPIGVTETCNAANFTHVCINTVRPLSELARVVMKVDFFISRNTKLV
jgi:hypothetical protein